MDTLHKNLDPRAKNILGFLINKGLLWTNQPIKPYFGKITIQDALWTAENVEPRVYEVLPAAIIHFPKTFIGLKNLPQDLNAIIKKIKNRKTPDQEEWKGMKIKNMIRWANIRLKDKRTIRLSEMKKNRTFSFSSEANKRLKENAKNKKMSETEFLENLILQVRN